MDSHSFRKHRNRQGGVQVCYFKKERTPAGKEVGGTADVAESPPTMPIPAYLSDVGDENIQK